MSCEVTSSHPRLCPEATNWLPRLVSAVGWLKKNTFGIKISREKENYGKARQIKKGEIKESAYLFEGRWRESSRTLKVSGEFFLL